MPRQELHALQGIPVHRTLTIDGSGQDLGACRFARPPRSGKEVSMRKPARRHLPLECIGDMGLAYHIIKCAGPPFSIERLVQSNHLK